MKFNDYFDSPIGLLEIRATELTLCEIHIASSLADSHANDITAATKRQLELYFMRKLKTFDLPLCISNARFYARVWKELLKIPYGNTKSYKEIAHKIGNPKAARAIGNANKNNPILIVIPCHRVVKSDRSIGGYRLGIEIKSIC